MAALLVLRRKCGFLVEAARARASGWAATALQHRPIVRLGLVPAEAIPLGTAEPEVASALRP